MFWNKKDDKDSLPDLPPLKNSLRSPFDLPIKDSLLKAPPSASEDTSQSLPSFTESPMEKPFSQTEIKSAVEQPMQEEREELPLISPSRMKTMEMDSPLMTLKPQRPFSLDSPPEENAYVPPRKPAQRSSEVFVKLERFNSAHRSIIGIKKKIDEIDSALKRIREIKMREEQELSAWEKEISSLKSHLQEVNDTLFE